MNKSAIFNAGEIIRYHREKEFLKIPKKSLIAVFAVTNNKKNLKMLERFETHLQGREFLKKHEVRCPECQCSHEIKIGSPTKSVPYAVTRSMTGSPKQFTLYQVWVEQVAEG